MFLNTIGHQNRTRSKISLKNATRAVQKSNRWINGQKIIGLVEKKVLEKGGGKWNFCCSRWSIVHK